MAGVPPGRANRTVSRLGGGVLVAMTIHERVKLRVGKSDGSSAPAHRISRGGGPLRTVVNGLSSAVTKVSPVVDRRYGVRPVDKVVRHYRVDGR